LVELVVDKSKNRRVRAVTSVCSLTEIENRSQSIRLFDRSIWINAGDGQIFNPQTRQIDSLSKRFEDIRTAALPGKVIFAKRSKRSDPLCLVEFPYKIRS
jgi:hypothetical protein